MYVACRARHRLSVMHVCSAATTEHVVDILAPKVIVQANVATFFFFFLRFMNVMMGRKYSVELDMASALNAAATATTTKQIKRG